MSTIDCILYPQTLDYNYLVQRPQQLMKHFSELGVPSFFLNLPSPHSNTPQGIVKPNDNLYVFNQVDPMPYLQGIRPVVYFSAASHIDIVQQYNPSLLVFDSVDEPSDEFEAWKPYYLRAVSLSDVVLCTSDRLFETARSINPHSYLVPNGCDYNHFSQAAGKTLSVPADIASIPGPIIGYVGVVATWVDLQLIDRLAAEFPDCSVVVVGPLYNVNDVPQRSNLHWLGFKPYEELAAYTQQFSVGIIPFIQSNMTESVNPIKMWEYIASGLPVVSTAIPEAGKFQDLVFYSNNHDEFIYNVYRALHYDTAELRAQRLVLAEENSWRHRAQLVLSIVEERLAGRGQAGGLGRGYIDSIPDAGHDHGPDGHFQEGFFDDEYADFEDVFCPDHHPGGHFDGHERRWGHETIDALIDTLPPQTSIIQLWTTHSRLKISTRRPVHIQNIVKMPLEKHRVRVHCRLVTSIRPKFKPLLERKGVRVRRRKHIRFGSYRVANRRVHAR
jgi:glycosyltransferase involved in cell wall biosynthesis